MDRPSSFPRSRNFLPSGSSQPSGSFATVLSLYIYIYVYCHFELLLAASFFSVLSTSNCFSFHDIVSTIYAIVVGEDSLKNVTTLLDVRHRVECNAN